MRIGDYKLYSIETSQFSLDGGAMFGIIPKTLWEKEAPADSYNRINMVTRSLLLVGNDRKIIIDTGNGDKWNKKFRSIYNIDLEKINLNISLSKIGISTDDITDVFALTCILIMLAEIPNMRKIKLFQHLRMLLIGLIKTIGI